MTIPLKGVRKSRQIELAASSSLQMVDPTQCLEFEGNPNYFAIMRQTNIPAMAKQPTPEEIQALQALERMGEQLDKNFAVEFLRGSNFYDTSMTTTGGPTKLSSSSSDKNLPSSAVATLKLWFLAHQHDPYPTKEEKDRLMQETGLSHVQLKNWFSNIRKRHWHPIRSGSRRPRSHVEYILMMGSARQAPVPVSQTQHSIVATTNPQQQQHQLDHSRKDSSESTISSPMRKCQRMMIEDEDYDEMDDDSDAE